jgi:hypothetical protein
MPGAVLFAVLQYGKATSFIAPQDHVGDHEIYRAGIELACGGLRVPRFRHHIAGAGQRASERLAGIRVVFHKQEAFHGVRGSVRRKTVRGGFPLRR